MASSTGCVSKSLKVSHVLNAIGLSPSLARNAIIMSLGRDNTVEEMDYVAGAMAGIVEKLRSMSPSWEEFQQRKKGRVI